MSTSAVSSTDYWKTATSTSTSTTSSSLDFDSFLSLLVTELQYQDPTEPVSTTEYVSQMAQLSMIQQLDTINNSVDAYRAYSLIGKEVSYETTDSATGTTSTQTGTVESVITQSSGVYLVIDGSKIAVSSIVEVSG